MFFGLSYGYLLLIVVTLAIGGLATWYVNSQLKKYIIAYACVIISEYLFLF